MKFSFEFLYSFGPTHARKIEVLTLYSVTQRVKRCYAVYAVVVCPSIRNIYIFIRINCSFKNKKFKKTKEKDTHNVSKNTRVKCILTMHNGSAR